MYRWPGRWGPATRGPASPDGLKVGLELGDEDRFACGVVVYLSDCVGTP